MKKILLIWNEFPETTKFFSFPLEGNEDRVKVLEVANDLYFNSSEMDDAQKDAMDKILNGVCDAECQYAHQETWGGWLLDKEIQASDLPNAGPFERSFICGTIL